jgi:hypothetical protein
MMSRKQKRVWRDEAFEEKGYGGSLAVLGEFFASSRLKWGTAAVLPPTPPKHFSKTGLDQFQYE